MRTIIYGCDICNKAFHDKSKLSEITVTTSNGYERTIEVCDDCYSQFLHSWEKFIGDKVTEQDINPNIPEEWISCNDELPPFNKLVNVLIREDGRLIEESGIYIRRLFEQDVMNANYGLPLVTDDIWTSPKGYELYGVIAWRPKVGEE